MDVLDYADNIRTSQEQKQIANFNQDYVREMLDYWDNNLTNIFRRQKDILVADAVLEMFRRSENIENFNKKALYILIRERTGSNTQHITRVINQMKKQYLKMQKMFQSSGSVANMNTGSYMQAIFG